MPTRVLGPRANFLAIDRDISAFASSRIVVLPAPYEHSVSYGGGTRRGPAGIIEASHFVELYDEELDRELCREIGIATLPSIQFGARKDASAVRLLQSAVEQLLKAGKFVVTLGGEHTISAGPIAAFSKVYPNLSVLHIDAHSDLRDEYQGSRYSHASVMARVCELIPPGRLVQAGIRAQCIEEARFIREQGIHTVYAYQIRNGLTSRPWQEFVLEHLTEDVYVSFDVDGLDPSIMPSTGTPEPNGLLWAETMQLLRRVGEEHRIVGCDVVELAPVKGIAHPDLTAAKLTYKLMNYAFPRQ